MGRTLPAPTLGSLRSSVTAGPTRGTGEETRTGERSVLSGAVITYTTLQPPHGVDGIAVTERHHITNIAPSQLEIAVAQHGTTTTIVFVGEWDLAEQHATRQAIRSAMACPPECMVLDLSQLTFIDTSAIHVILELQSRAARQNTRLVITPGGRAVQRPFEVLGLAAALPFLNATAW
jgi:anti-sigma B factor antagonist